MVNQANRNIRSRSIRIVAAVLLAVAVFLGTFWFTVRIADTMIRSHAPLVDASMEIRSNLALFHLWLEEYILGDSEIPPERFMDHIEVAEWYANAMVMGGENDKEVFLAVENEALLEELSHVKEDIAELRRITRLRIGEKAGPASEHDKEFDAAFLKTLDEAEHVEIQLQAVIARERQDFKYLSTALFGFSSVLGLFAGLVLLRYENRRVEDMVSLAVSREDLRVTLNSLGDGVISTDRVGKVLRMNPEAESLTGWKESGALGKPFKEVFRLIDEKTREPLDDPVTYVIDTGWPTDLPKDAMLVSRDGAMTPINYAATPVFGSEGKLRGAVVVFRDASGQREFERYLARFKFVMDNSGEEFYLVSPTGEITYANAAAEKSLGYPETGLVGMHIGEIDPNMQPGRYAEFYSLLEKSEPGAFETTHMRSDGQQVDKEVRFGRMDYFGEGYACAIARDISERKRVERMRSDFYSMVTHDLRSPMTTLLGFLELIEETKKDSLDNDTYEMFVTIKSSANKVYALINDFLTLSKLESGAMMLEKSLLSPSHLAGRVAEEFAGRARAAGLTIVTEIREDLPRIDADGIQVERALGNLLENAVNYTPKGGRVTVGAKQVDGGVSLYVADSGPGIDPDDRERIFSKYYRSRNTSRVKGTGLGLAIVAAAAKAHGGRVELDSEPGRGARFSIILPVPEE